MSPLTRTRQLLGEDAVKKIEQSRVAVFGLGAVGSYAVEALARAGVGYLRLVDFDRVDPSNINRQLFALRSTVGQEKAVVARDRVLDINPGCRVDLKTEFVNADSLASLLSRDLDLVVDAIDGLNSKVNLLFEARRMDLPVAASMGAGGRTDPMRIRTGDISETTVCPLARVVRRRLHRRGLFSGIRCVWSVEKPRNKQPFDAVPGDPVPAGPVACDGADTGETAGTGETAAGYAATTGHGRERPPIGTVPWIPGIFGLTLAGEAVNMIIR